VGPAALDMRKSPDVQGAARRRLYQDAIKSIGSAAARTETWKDGTITSWRGHCAKPYRKARWLHRLPSFGPSQSGGAVRGAIVEVLRGKVALGSSPRVTSGG